MNLYRKASQSKTLAQGEVLPLCPMRSDFDHQMSECMNHLCLNGEPKYEVANVFGGFDRCCPNVATRWSDRDRSLAICPRCVHRTRALPLSLGWVKAFVSCVAIVNKFWCCLFFLGCLGLLRISELVVVEV